MERMRYSVRSLALLASMMSNRYNVKVTSSGNAAYTKRNSDGTVTINIPVVAVDDPDYSVLLNGFIDHETGHHLHSDWGCIEKSVQMGAFYKNVNNIFEDCMIEEHISSIYPGCRVNLHALADLLFVDRYKAAEPVTEHEHVLMRIAQFILYASRAVENENIAGKLEDRTTELDEAMPFLADRLLPVCRKVQFAQTSEDSLALTQEVKDILSKWLDDEENAVDTQRSTGMSDEEMQELADALSGGGQQGEGNDEDYGTSVGRQAQDAMNRNEDWHRVQGQYDDRYNSMQDDTTDACRGVGGVEGAVNAGFDDLSEKDAIEAQAASAALAAQLASLLQSKTLNREGHRRRGRLDLHSLHRLAVNDPRIFEKRTEKVKVNAEVIVLVDASGSMMGESAEVTSQSVYALCRALTGLHGIKCAAYAFNDDHFTKLLGFGEMCTGQGFNMRAPCGGTPGGMAVHKALQRFTWNDSRKLLVVMTDGGIQDENVWKVNMELARENHIEVAGVGICDTAIQNLLPESECRVVNNVNDLPNALFGILQGRLLYA